MKRLTLLVMVFLCLFVVVTCNDDDDDNNDDSTSLVPWIDIHTHPLGVDTDCTTVDCINEAVQLMDTYGVRKAVLMHPPAPGGAMDQSQENLVRTSVGFRPDLCV